MSGGSFVANHADEFGGGLCAADLSHVVIGANAAFRCNFAPVRYNIDVSDNSAYQSKILCDQWTKPYYNGLNNCDIGSFGLLLGEIPASDVFYDVTFDTNGGSPDSIPSRAVFDGAAVCLPNPPRSRYGVFCGWYRDTGLTQPYAEGDPIIGNTALYAKYCDPGGWIAPDQCKAN
jgi:hypothetical protein